MNRVNIVAFFTCFFVVVGIFLYSRTDYLAQEKGVMSVGFVYENDESTSYTYNFVRAQERVKNELGERVEILTKNNVFSQEIEEAVRELVHRGCSLIFTNSSSEEFMDTARYFPQVEFCQVSTCEMENLEFPENFHTMNTAAHEGYYVSGLAAGMKLQSLIDGEVLKPDQALVGFVGSGPTPEVISAYTAFLLGVREKAPTATMKVGYAGQTTNFSREKALARRLIEEGCVVISQTTHTIGPALACEEQGENRPVCHVAFDQSMIEVAPTTALISVKNDWSAYCIAAVKASLQDKPIEKVVEGKVHGRDVVAGFEKGWIQILELNEQVAVPGTREELEEAIAGFEKGTTRVFVGDYQGADPFDPTDTYDLKDGYIENEHFSAPSFHYQLFDVVEILKEDGEE